MAAQRAVRIHLACDYCIERISGSILGISRKKNAKSLTTDIFGRRHLDTSSDTTRRDATRSKWQGDSKVEPLEPRELATLDYATLSTIRACCPAIPLSRRTMNTVTWLSPSRNIFTGWNNPNRGKGVGFATVWGLFEHCDIMTDNNVSACRQNNPSGIILPPIAI